MSSNSKNKNVIQQTPPSLSGKARVDFRKSDFDAVVEQKGYRIYIDKAIKCPCSAVNNSQALSNCRNCGGVGWVFLNRIETRAVLQSINVDTKYKEWGEERLGMIKITCRDEEQLSYMDRITLIDADSLYNELLYPKNINENNQGDASLQARCAFDIVSVECIFAFDKSEVPLKKLEEGTDYTINPDHPNIIEFDDKYLNQENFTISIRYEHSPSYHVLDLSRDVMVTDIINKDGKSESVTLPVHGVGRRAQYVLDEENVYNTYLHDNSYKPSCSTQYVSKECRQGLVRIYKEDQINLIADVNVDSGGIEKYFVQDGKLNINGTFSGINLPATDNQNINIVNQDNENLSVVGITNNNVTVNTHWTRNPQWLDLPEVNVGDERFVGLYAVFENDVDDNTITINIGAGNSIDYGDGTVITSATGDNAHQYDYATINSPVLQLPNGVNYKMVIVDVDLTGVIDLNLNDEISGRPPRKTGWLDIICDGSSLRQVNLSGSISLNEAYASYLERFILLNADLGTATNNNRAFNNCFNLKVFDYPLLDVVSGINSFFYNAGNKNVLNSNNSPISINNSNTTDLRFAFYNTSILEVGNIIVTSCNNGEFCFWQSDIVKIGNLDLPSCANLRGFIRESKLEEIGTITVTTSLTSIREFAQQTHNVQSIVFSGDMSSVTDTFRFALQAYQLEELITPNLTIGIELEDTRLTGDNLQAFFTSLGIANGAQTITLPSFTIGEPTAIATGKGYTIAYA